MTPEEALERPAEKRVERAAASQDSSATLPERVCPNCGAVLIERKCKLLCPEPACGYYMSCTDFY